MNAPVRAVSAGSDREIVEHLAQDLRAEAHQVPPAVGALLRRAALVCDRLLELEAAFGAEPFADMHAGIPIPPPEEDQDNEA